MYILTQSTRQSNNGLALGGFKESCTANRMCRHCMATKGTAQTQVN